jgi:hypothetical protein
MAKPKWPPVARVTSQWHKCERCGKPTWARIDRYPIVLCEKCAMRDTLFNVFGWCLKHSLMWILILTGLACVFEACRHFIRAWN